VTTAHEPRRGPGIHLSVEDLSALAEGAQPVAEGASEHLLDCAECRGEVDSIAQLLAAFETLEPPRMPPEVAIRIDAALVREAAARTSAPQPGAAAATASGGGARSGQSRWRLSRRIGLGLASLATLTGGLVLAVNLVSSGGSSGSAASGSAALRPDVATTNAGPMRAGAEGPFGSTGMAVPTVPPNSPLAVWTKQALGAATPKLELNSSCVADPAFGGAQPLRVVNGTFDGAAATLVVYANGADTTTVRAIVYAPPCAAANYHVLAQGIVEK
jgi:hypothetical protein